MTNQSPSGSDDPSRLPATSGQARAEDEALADSLAALDTRFLLPTWTSPKC